MKIQFEPEKYYRIKVIPKQSKTEFREILEDGTIKIALNAIPEKGRANKELISFLASYTQVPKDQVKIISGLTSRLKIISISK